MEVIALKVPHQKLRCKLQQGLTRLLRALCKSVFTDCRYISTLYYTSCEIVWIYLVFCVLYVNQSLLTVEIYRHSITLHVK
jgi:hypothetical protein